MLRPPRSRWSWFLASTLLLAVATSPLLALSPKAKTLLRQALDENRAGNFGRALQLFFEAHKEDPDVLAQDDEGLLQNASRWLDGELKRDDTDPHSHFQQAELKMLQGLPGEALGHYEKVAQLAPGSSLANLAQPAIQGIKAQLKAASMTYVAASGGGGGAATSAPGADKALKEQVESLQKDLEEARREVERLKGDLTRERARPDASSDLEKLRQEFEDYKKQAEEWKLYHRLFFADPANVRKLQGS